MYLKDWRYYRENWKPQRLKNRGPPAGLLISRLDDALLRLDKLRHRSTSQLLLYANLLRQCGNQRALDHGRRVHAHIVSRRLARNALLGELVFQMYARCRCFDTAIALFDAMPDRRPFCWNVLMKEFLAADRPRDTLELYRRMSVENTQPSACGFMWAIVACGRIKDLAQGRSIHYRVATGRGINSSIQSALVTMYAQCGRIDLAMAAFDDNRELGTAPWNAIMSALAGAGHHRRAIELFFQMEQHQCSDRSCAIALGACAAAGHLRGGIQIHDKIQSEIHGTRVLVLNALISMYVRCGKLDEALRVFADMPHRNVVSWTSMIAAVAQSGHYSFAVKLFDGMIAEGINPNEKTYASVVSAIAHLGRDAILDRGRKIHSQITASGIDADPIVQNSLINMYARSGLLAEAREVFDSILENSKTVVSFTTMIAAYAHNGHPRQALEIFREMTARGVAPNEITFATVLAACVAIGDLASGAWIHERMIESGLDSSDPFAYNSLVDMYAKCGDLGFAARVFETMKTKDLVAWTTIIAANVQSGNNRAALDLYDRMLQSGIHPDIATLSTLLVACANLGDLAMGEKIHRQALRSKLEQDAHFQNALAAMYAKCGSLEKATRLYRRCRGSDVATWTSMLAAHSQQGLASVALELYAEMESEGVRPNEVTFIPVLISCSQAGLVAEGREFFHSITSDYGSQPSAEHFGCMVDVLGRAGKLRDAEELLDSMPFYPDEIAWQSLLSSCKLHTDAEIGTRAAECLLELDPESTSQFVALSQIYAAAGRNSDIDEIKRELALRRQIEVHRTTGELANWE
ncbi:hypothetical protein SELMODRAFT_106630 [Selaginella moellendorffii]|uniref:Pentacotripeptide-repeat region of PRORP domain-containing protein n=2 Tax=Selaginella moellendorffii TaxID=88036 RepID=D8S155_SELML|nr:hypothetical protein SELMODRAFT_106630 [Selaginella moellendorffii]